MPTKALVLAAGVGSRIRSISGDLPKPLMPFAGTPILARNLRWLAFGGVRDIYVNLHHQADAIRAQIGDGSSLGVRVTYVYEPQLLGTAGALANIADLYGFSETMAVIYGDNVIKCDLAALQADHTAHKAECTIALFDQGKHSHTGIAGGRVVVDGAGDVSGFAEGAKSGSNLVNAGVYALEPSILDLIPRGALVDFGRDVFPAMLAAGRSLRAHVIEPDGYCLGLDTPEAYHTGIDLVQSGKVRLI
jgi:NDP-sugar pyrophosphorylase family protein